MENFFCQFLLPLLLIAAALVNWSLISLVDLVAFLVIQFNLPRRDFHFRRLILFLWGISIYSLLVALVQTIFTITWEIKEDKWSLEDTSWVELIGLMRFHSWRSPTAIFYVIIQVIVGFVCLVWLYQHKLGMVPWRGSCWGNFSSILESLGSYFKVVFCFLLPAIQLVVGISHPSWVSLPFFICSCVGLVDWSLTSNFSGLFRWWRSLQLYACFNILILYTYQLPVQFPTLLQQIANFLGLYKISVESGWLEICSGLSLICFYVMLSCIKNDLEEMEFMMSSSESDLTEQLLPARNSFFIRQLRSGERHTNFLVKGAVFRTFTINFFTYGFPLSLVALSFWTFHFASICAFGLLAYVGYIVYAFPSLFHLHRLNSLLLVFTLLWAVSTYIFNVAFSIVNWELGKNMEIWELVGLWRYTIPGYFLLAQFGLGVLIAVGNLVNNSVFTYLSNENGHLPNGDPTIEVKEETKVLIVATIAWGFRKCSRAIMLALIFLIAMKPGFIHAIYMIFFLIYLLGHNISRKIRKALILLCEAHFALLYILQINLISTKLEHGGSLTSEILSQLGLRDSSWDFLETALLACFCTIHNHGFDMLFSFSAFVQHTPYPPVGFSVLKAGLNKSVLLSVYCSSASGDSSNGPSHERRIASYLSAVGQKFLAVYRSWGTYIAFLTILIAVYLVRPNYISFGYIFLLLFWIIGRQLVEQTKRRLWFPLKAYAIMVFVFMYSLSIFPSFQTWLSHIIDLYPNLGYKPEASLLDNIWESMAILIVMQLYSYERRQSKYNEPCDTNVLQSGTVGFMRRFMIWHSNKLLFAALFYAAISQINAIGFVYLLGMIICSTFPKTSRVPSKSFLVYTGFVVMVEYLFQMWGQQAKMFPGQMHSDVSHVLGLQVFEPGFWGIESSLRGNVLVISACTLQYNVFHWLDRMPNNNVLMGEWEEPCPLFVTAEDDAVTMSSYDEENSSVPHSTLSDMVKTTASYTWKSNTTDPSEPILLGRESENSRTERYSSGYFWETIKESQKWNKRRILALRNERFDMQKTTLKVYLMFWIENMFNLFGLEINMIVLLLASFALLNVISLLYIGLLATFVLLDRRIIRKLWSVLVFLFACVLILEYFSIWENKMSLNRQSPHEIAVRCHDCWKSSKLHFQYCQRCWLGLVVDDTRMLISYFIVFIVACFKLRADRSPNLSGSFTFNQMMSQRKNIFVWKDLSFETKSMWTIFDYLRLYCYCHLLDLVLTLILITGTLEYDILHLGYLGFALVFFRMRLEILRKRNKIFKFLRMYNFVIIVLSLAYQSPFIGVFNEGKCGTVGYIYEAIGFYKYDYGFRITSRSALVEIVIFMLVSLQSYMFSSPEFEHVSRYLEAEQIGAIVREQEKKAAWKTSQLQHIRETEEEKRQRNMQVEKMKSEMLDLQVQLHSMNSPGNHGQLSPGSGGLRKRRSASFIVDKNFTAADKEELLSPSFNFDRGFRAAHTLREGQKTSGDFALPSELLGSPVKRKSESPIAEQLTTQDSKEISFGEITEIEDSDHQSVVEKKRESSKGQSKDHPLKSAVQLIGDGVSQVQSLGNQAVTNLASLLNVSQEDLDSTGHSSDDDVGCGEMESQNPENVHIARTSSLQSDKSRTMSESVKLKLLRIFRHIWSQMRSNNDIVCYCCFILVFLWNFSLLSMVYLAALFFYALCVNTGPSYTFWVVMLIYTEFYILIEYLYQIIIQHCGLIDLTLLQELGFPHHKINSSFVISSLPLFLVYLFTLLQSSITAQDGDWSALSEFNAIKRKMHERKYVGPCSSWSEKLNKIFQPLKDGVEMIARSCLSYWKSLTQGAESPPYFVQLSMDVGAWPEDGIQPEKIESGMNQLLQLVHSEHCKGENPNVCPSACRVNIQSIERSEENPNVALAVFEVVHALPLRDCVSKGWSKSLTPASDVAREVLIAKCLGYVEEVGFPYPVLSVIGGGKREVDLYAYVFGADLAVFFLVAIFYQSVIKNKSDFLGVYQLEDQFPKEYVFILMVIFFLIVVDRIIYLCSFATGKVLFYLFNLVLFTYSVTEYAWNMQPFQQYAGILALRAIFLTKAVSLALQAIQIRYGMPHKSTLYRQFLTSTVSRINYLGYRLYRALPFLYELRCVLDWSCTTTSLTMYDWLKLEDINASLYLVKCDAILNRASHKQGEKQPKMTKFCSGICLFLILICVIWAPMLMYSSGNPTNIANPVRDVSVQVDIKTNGGRLTLYQTTLCEKLEWENVKNKDDLDPQGLLTTYDMNDIQLICCQADASTLWLVPEVVQKRFTESLNVGRDMHIIFSWVLTRDRPKGKEVVKYERDVDNASDLPKRSELQSVFNGSMNSFRVKNIFPRFFRVTGSGDVRPFEPELKVDADLVINHQNPEWWSFYDVNPLNVSRCEGLTGPTAIVVSEETPQGLLGDTLSKFSIWGLYITFVLAVGRFIRLQCSDLRMRIPYENLPSCDRLIAICEDIYAARAEGELGVEEVLYWTLVKIYRSPHMLLEYTKPD
ncbi:piezo-type mechanosensitive ion channel homolog [Chenopodium quinoa]|uniref:piezo-type mechanosensitive ion channel homolog n=1 Tax=Chenopodium quinoa TaxID=63459 RepID=UPI000B778CD7|nr:piezo-type mechanosensitive ion channel homolog [Chenopodium quinoa]